MSFCLQCTIDTLWPPLVGATGVLFGVWMNSHLTRVGLKQDLDLRYKFAIFDQRMAAAQECYLWARKLGSVYCVSTKDEEKYRQKLDVVDAAGVWYDAHCLYLTPAVRAKFFEVRQQVSSYELTLQIAIHDAHVSKDSPKAEKANEELKSVFNSIKRELTDLLEAEIDDSLWSKIQ